MAPPGAQLLGILRFGAGTSWTEAGSQTASLQVLFSHRWKQDRATPSLRVNGQYKASELARLCASGRNMAFCLFLVNRAVPSPCCPPGPSSSTTHRDPELESLHPRSEFVPHRLQPWPGPDTSSESAPISEHLCKMRRRKAVKQASVCNCLASILKEVRPSLISFLL